MSDRFYFVLVESNEESKKINGTLLHHLHICIVVLTLFSHAVTISPVRIACQDFVSLFCSPPYIVLHLTMYPKQNLHTAKYIQTLHSNPFKPFYSQNFPHPVGRLYLASAICSPIRHKPNGQHLHKQTWPVIIKPYRL